MNLSSAVVLLSFALISSSVEAIPVIPSSLSLSFEKKINLNTASINELTHAIKGIGKQRAEAILQFRKSHGAFKNFTDLASVRGIGIRFVQKHRGELEAKFYL